MKQFPCQETIELTIQELKAYLFPNHFGCIQNDDNLLKQNILSLIDISLKLNHDSRSSQKIVNEFFIDLTNVKELLLKDAKAGFEGDPAAESIDEVILAYPGWFAIFVNRIAHILYQNSIPLLPRMMTEYAHSKTGIDIHPGATIGEYFFIDHGTGVVIGETTIIGNHVKLYQGVTLGAISTKGGQKLKNTKRHPTLQNNVTVYANATILGGETVIGENVVIGGNAFIMESIESNQKVLHQTK